MSIDASTLTVVVNSEGIEQTTKALNDLAAAGENAEKKTSNIGSGAKDSTKVIGDAAVEAAKKFNTSIDTMQQHVEQLSQTSAAAAIANANAITSQADATRQSSAAADAFVEKLRRQADMVGMNAQQMKEYRAQMLSAKADQLGVSDQVDGYIKKLLQAKGAHEGLSLATAGSTREMIVLFHELATGNFQKFFGSLIVEANRMNIMPSILKGIGAAAEALGVSAWTLGAAFVAVAGIAIAGVVSYNKSTTALREMKDAVVMTGGAIGATGDQLYSMANNIGEATGEFGKAREAVIALANTGKFSADQINMIAEAAVNLEKFGGQSIEKTAAMFEKLAGNPLKITDKGFKDVSNAAMQLDEQLHFLSPTVLAHIMDLERQGEHASASKLAIAALAEEEKKRGEELKENLTPLGALLEEIGEKASKMWDAIFHTESKGETLTRIQAALREYDDHPIWTMLNDGMTKEQADKLRQEAHQLTNEILQDNYNAAEQAHKKTMDRLSNEQLTYMRNLMERSKGEENLQQRLLRFDTIIAQQREKAKNDPAYAAQTQTFLSDAAVAMMRKQVERDSIKAGAKPKSDGLAGVNDEISKVQSQYDIEKNLIDNQIKLVDAKNQRKMLSDSAATAAKDKLLDQEAKLEEETLNKELQIREKFYSADKKLMEQNDKAKNDLRKRLTVAAQNTDMKSQINALDDFDPKAQAKYGKESEQQVAQIVSQTQLLQAKVDAWNMLSDDAKKSIKNEKEFADKVTEAEIAFKEQKLAAVSAMGDAADKEVTRLKSQIEALKDRAKAQKDLEEIQKKMAANIANNPTLNKIATDQIKMWKDTGNEIEKALKNAFGSAGDAAGKMFKAFADGQANQIDLANKIREVKQNQYMDETVKEQQLTDLRQQSTMSELGQYGQMADAAKGFFKEGSTGYQAMAKAAMVLHTAEVALSLIKGVNAILTQGEGDPYTAFGRMAAMTAIVAGLGVAVSGGGGGSGPMSSANQQKVQGTGTVLGTPTITDGVNVRLVGAKSDSIANSLKIAEKNSGLGLVVQNDMLSALQKLNNSIAAFATLVVQNSGLTGVTAATKSPFDSKVVSGIGAVAGGVGGAAVGTYIGMGIGAIGGPLGMALGAALGAVLGHGIIGKALTSVFGGKVTTDDTGLNIGSASLGQVAQSGLTANQYTNTTTSGGWFRSDKHDTAMTSLGSEFNNQITQVVMGMEDTLKVAAKGLGMDANAFNDKLQSFVVDIGNVSLKGLTGDQIQQTLQNIFSKLGDQMATFAFGDLQKYQKIGEGLMETVVRVANDLQQVNDVFAVLGKTIPKNLEAIAQSEAMIAEFGSVDNLTKGVKAYVSAIYTDQEKMAYISKSVNDAMGDLHLSAVKTKDAFKAVVDGLDLTTQAGQDMFAKLMNIAPQFGQMLDDTDKAVTSARTALTDAYNRESQALTDTKTKMQSLVTTLKQLGSDSLLGDLSPLTPQQKYLEAKSQFETVAAKAQAGDTTAQGQFQSAYNNFLQASKVANASGDQYQKDFEEAQKVTQQATAWAQKQVDVAQATLDALNKQVAGLIDVNAGLLTVSQAINNLITALAAAGDPSAKQKATSNTQDAISGLYKSILGRTADQAGLNFFTDAVMNKGSSMTDVASSLSNSAEAKIDELYQSIFHRQADQAGLDFWVKAVNNGTSLSDVESAFKGSAEGSGAVSPAQSIAPVTAMMSSQSASHADVVNAINNMTDAITTAVAESGQNTTTTVQNLIGATIDSHAAAADTTVTGITQAIQSSKVNTTYAIQQR